MSNETRLRTIDIERHHRLRNLLTAEAIETSSGKQKKITGLQTLLVDRSWLGLNVAGTLQFRLTRRRSTRNDPPASLDRIMYAPHHLYYERKKNFRIYITETIDRHAGLP